MIARAPFAGYWEYLLDEALFTGPGHPHWSGAALIGASGALMGVGSLQMNQEVGRWGLHADQHVRSDRALAADRGRPFAGAAGPPAEALAGLLSQDAGTGVVVMDVSPGGPAAGADVRPGDVILAVAGSR